MNLINDRVYIPDNATTAVEVKSNSVVVHVQGAAFEFPAKTPAVTAKRLARGLIRSGSPYKITVEPPVVVHDPRSPMSTEEFQKLPFNYVVTQECIAGHKCRYPDTCPHPLEPR